ncbi:MAG: Mur ligase family protein [Chlamydiales bacterium]
MHILIIGLGISGQAVKNFCEERGDTISIYDDALPPQPLAFEKIDLAIKSPGIPSTHPLVKSLQKYPIPVIGEIDLALQEIQDQTIYAITGSNGKTTTTLLATHLLNLSGKKAMAVGNIGIPLISQVKSDVEIFVLELSSFQLESILIGHHFNRAVLLNITPNHLDWHLTFEAYTKAKLRLQACLKKGAPFFTTHSIAKQFCPGATILPIETIASLSYRNRQFYPHDLENIAAAYALTSVDQNRLKQGLDTFTKPPHRIEFVREYRGIHFVNDSKATSIDAVIKAIHTIKTSIVLIAGGVDKGGCYANWLSVFHQKVRKVFAMGEAAKKMENALAFEIQLEKVGSLEEGIKQATLFAKKGETVLLSPGCSSYDQFKNYEERGDRFKEIVYALEEIV